MSKHGDSEVYPNSPLEDVACEIRFPGEMEVECDRHRFWEDIRKDYPHIRVPKIVADAPPALQHYRFCSESGNRRVSVALNSLAFSDTDYTGHESFTKEFCRIADIFHKNYKKIKSVSRIGWRYINLIPFARDGDLVPVKQLLRADLLLPKNALDAPKALDIRVESKLDEGTAIVRLATVTRDAPDSASQEALLLDIDFACEGPDLHYKDYRTYLEIARRHNRQLFEEIITDEYRSYLRGDTL